LSLEENVRKEVAEEYGVTDIHIQNQLPAHSYGTTHNEHTAHWIIIGFFVNVNPQKVVNNEPHKIETIEWFRLQQ
ncbi:MAG: NUDIX hydrolase, partial [Candidatus Paceibacteria bacterium]